MTLPSREASCFYTAAVTCIKAQSLPTIVDVAIPSQPSSVRSPPKGTATEASKLPRGAGLFLCSSFQGPHSARSAALEGPRPPVSVWRQGGPAWGPGHLDGTGWKGAAAWARGPQGPGASRSVGHPRQKPAARGRGGRCSSAWTAEIGAARYQGSFHACDRITSKGGAARRLSSSGQPSRQDPAAGSQPCKGQG